jgi:hypothetical protein
MAVDVVAGRLAAHIKNAIEIAGVVGTAVGEVGKVVDRDVVLAVGVNLDLDMTAIGDAGNDVVAFAAVSHVMYRNTSATPGEDVTIGGGANPLFPVDPTAVPPGGIWFRVFPDGVTVDATHKTFRFATAAGAAVPGVLTVWGR